MTAGRRKVAALAKSSPLVIKDELVGRLQKAWGESLFYQARLKGPAPDRFLCLLQDPYDGDKDKAKAILRGKIIVGDETLECEGELDSAFEKARKGTAIYQYLHRFYWLRDLAALGDDGVDAAMTLARAWFAANGKWSPESWTPSLAAERLVQLSCHGGLVYGGGDVLWRSSFLTSMARQTRHLAHAGHGAQSAQERLNAAFAVCISGLCLPGCGEALARGLQILRRELRLQIRQDGGHVSRNPSRQLEIVLRIRMVLQAMAERGQEPPGYLAHILVRAAGHLEMFRLGDGRLAGFNGGFEEDREAIDAALKEHRESAAPTGFARHSGFQRLHSGRTVLVAEVGPPTGVKVPSRAYQGGGSFYFASGRSRIIVNCGAGTQVSEAWAAALRQASAHSTLSSEPVELIADYLAGAQSSQRRAEDKRGQLLEIGREFFPLQARRDAGLEEVFRHLPKGEALVAFVRYRHLSTSGAGSLGVPSWAARNASIAAHRRAARRGSAA